MSTDTPIPSAPEMPSTSNQAISSVQSFTDWDCFENENEGAATKTTSEATSLLGSPKTAATLSPTSSSTAYSFTGSALGAGSSANINTNDIKKDDNDVKNSNNTTTDEEKNDDSMYECNICLDTAKDAVVSMCGHLFCWPCLHQWLETRPNRKLCPVCKAAISKEKVIPLYGRNSSKQEDPRNKVPPRPAGQRTEPEPQQGFPGFGLGDGFHMSFGIGAFPFGYFASSFNFGEPRPVAANRGTTQYEDEQQLSKLFLYLAFLCIAWLLFA